MLWGVVVVKIVATVVTVAVAFLSAAVMGVGMDRQLVADAADAVAAVDGAAAVAAVFPWDVLEQVNKRRPHTLMAAGMQKLVEVSLALGCVLVVFVAMVVVVVAQVRVQVQVQVHGVLGGLLWLCGH